MKSLVLAVIAAVFASTAAPTRADETTDLAQLMLDASAAVDRGECKLADWDRITGHPGFAGLPSRIRSNVHLMPVLCGGGGERSLELILAATAEPEASALAWSTRFIHAAVDEKREDALLALENAAAKADDRTVDLYNDRVVFRFWDQLKDDKAARARMAAALEQIDWRPKARTSTPDSIWLAHASELLDAGDQAGAARFARKVSHVEVLVAMRTDRRFSDIIDAQPEAFDLKFAALATLAADQPELERTPLDAESVQAVAYDLRVLGRFEEALSLLEAAIRLPDLKNHRGEDWRNWIENERALVLVELGRFEEAVEAMRKASRANEMGGTNVSQTINLASMLNELGRFREVLTVLEPLATENSASPYGEMWIASNRACAYAGLQRLDQAQAEMKFLEDHVADNRVAHRVATLCLGDEEATARNLIDHLGSDEPIRALASFSKSRIEPPIPARARLLKERLERVQQRPEVRAAFDAVGRAETFDVYLGAMPF